MFVNSVLSFLGAWEKLQGQHPQTYELLLSAVQEVESPKSQPGVLGEIGRLAGRGSVSLDWARAFTYELSEHSWESNRRLSYQPVGKESNYVAILGFFKDCVGLEVLTRSFRDVESKLFVDFPFFVRAQEIEIGLILVPMSSLAREMERPSVSFEKHFDRLTSMPPLTLQYPFAIVGFSSDETEISVTELTSKIDQFLIEEIGIPLGEALAMNETRQYEFKLELPDNSVLAKEVCAFANASGGGLILLGIDKNGEVVGLPIGSELDDLKLRITNVISSRCRPIPEVEIHAFNLPEQDGLAIVVIKVDELSQKPCMLNDNRVYIRVEASARPAEPEEIRRLIVK